MKNTLVMSYCSSIQCIVSLFTLASLLEFKKRLKFGRKLSQEKFPDTQRNQNSVRINLSCDSHGSLFCVLGC